MGLSGPADLQSFSLFSLDSASDSVIMSGTIGRQILASYGSGKSSGISFSSTKTLEKNLFNTSISQIRFCKKPIPFQKLAITPP